MCPVKKIHKVEKALCKVHPVLGGRSALLQGHVFALASDATGPEEDIVLLPGKALRQKPFWESHKGHDW